MESDSRQGVLPSSERTSTQTAIQLALMENDDWHKDVVENGVSLLCVHDLRGHLLSVNSSAAVALGYTIDELLRIPMRELVPTELRSEFDVYMRHVSQAGEASGCLVVMTRLGERRIWRYHNTLRREGVAAPIVRGIAFDVTDQKQKCEQTEKHAQEKRNLDPQNSTHQGFDGIIGRSTTLRRIMEEVAQAAPSDATVLILGETGTGKELIARAIHQISGRWKNDLIKMNCAAVPSGLLESELFGHEKGAFTGAIQKKVGRLELAHRGTLFLDEIGEMPLELQPKLLRVLQDHEFERLGGTLTLNVDFRLIAATNRDLEDMVSEREFRSDLYYRLSVFPVHLPPLRERREDIPLLVEALVEKYSHRMNRAPGSIPPSTMDALVRWNWPGNIRELENFVERSIILSKGSVLEFPLSELEETPASAAPADGHLDSVKRQHIQDILRATHGNLSGAALKLGLPRTTLQSKLKQLGIDHRK